MGQRCILVAPCGFRTMANDLSPGAAPGRFEITRFLEGSTQADGLFEDRFGRVRRRFRAALTGRWDAGHFVLDEVFAYDDGSREDRRWVIVPGADGSFTASSPDCVGKAVGTSDHRSWRMRYAFRLKMGPRSIVVDFDDRVDQGDTGLAINRATVRKWGIRLGEVVLVMRKTAAIEPQRIRSEMVAAE